MIELSDWTVKFNITHSALHSLLPIFRKIPGLENLLNDSRKFLNIKKVIETNMLTCVNPGFCYHFGSTFAIQRYFLIICYYYLII